MLTFHVVIYHLTALPTEEENERVLENAQLLSKFLTHKVRPGCHGLCQPKERKQNCIKAGSCQGVGF